MVENPNPFFLGFGFSTTDIRVFNHRYSGFQPPTRPPALAAVRLKCPRKGFKGFKGFKVKKGGRFPPFFERQKGNPLKGDRWFAPEGRTSRKRVRDKTPNITAGRLGASLAGGEYSRLLVDCSGTSKALDASGVALKRKDKFDTKRGRA